MADHDHTNLGTVYLVGAGPGDPGSITLRAAECLGRAGVVLYDYLVNPVILAHAPPSAELVCLGHHGTGRTMPQQEINARMVDEARRGKTVVRLKGGDPSVFGRATEEIEALRKAGIPLEIVPGVTAALAAAGYAGIPITHGRQSSAVALVAGQQRPDKGDARLEYAALAGFPGTLVFYMGVTTAGQWSGAMIGRGKSPQTPAAIVRRCGWPDQQTIRCSLGTLAEVIARKKLRPPAVIVIGNVVDSAAELSWFAARPLFGTRILVTRPREGTDSLRRRLDELGAEVIPQPVIRISDPPDWGPVDTALARLDRYDWLVFSSGHGVRYLLDRLHDRGGDVRRLGRLKLAAVGPGTADQLAGYHLRADLVPQQFRAESLVEALAAEASGRRFLLPRASRGRPVLADGLAAAGGEVDQVIVYSSTDVTRPDAQVATAVAEGRIDWVTVTSSAIARSLVAMFGDDLRRTRLASISPLTSGVLRELGYPPTVEAAQYTMDGLVAAMMNEP